MQILKITTLALLTTTIFSFAAPGDTLDLLAGYGRFNETQSSEGWKLYAWNETQQHAYVGSAKKGMALILKNTGSNAEDWYAQAKIEVKVPHGTRLLPRGYAYSFRNKGGGVLLVGLEDELNKNYKEWWLDIDDYSEGGTQFYTDTEEAFDFCTKNHQSKNLYFYINGAGSSWDVAIPWIIVDMVPIECPGDAEYADSIARHSNAEAFVSHLGYSSNLSKKMTIKNGNNEIIYFKNSKGDTVYTATSSEPEVYAPSGDTVKVVDFSDFKTAGQYTIWQGPTRIHKTNVVLNIGTNPLDTAFRQTMRFFHMQRASYSPSTGYAGSNYSRSAGHYDSKVTLHASTGDSGVVRSSKGWYNGGDYGKYIVNANITVYTLLNLYEHFPSYLKKYKWGIPADSSFADLPNLLNEIKWELDWMFTMQASDGGVYHKLTSLSNPGSSVSPYSDKSNRYIIGKSASASLGFAAVMAKASRIYREYNIKYADSCLKVAQRAYEWAIENQDVHFTANPTDVKTKIYGDSSISDELELAKAELAISTQDKKYVSTETSRNIPNWQDVYGLATYSKATHPEIFGEVASKAKFAILKKADKLVARTEKGFGITMAEEDFVWGSNSVAANQGIWLLHAYYMTGEKKYLDASSTAIEYLFGKNPLGRSFVTGFSGKNGYMKIQEPYHRISEAVFESPYPGMLVGGPQNKDKKDELTYSEYSALAYIDKFEAYGTNEPTIDANAALAYLLGATIAIDHNEKPDFMDSAIELSTIDDGIGETEEHTTSIARNTATDTKIHQAKLYFDGHALFIKKSGKSYNLNGKKISSKR